MVPHFEEEDSRCEMTNLPAIEGPLTPNECLVVKIFDPPNFALRTIYECVGESAPSVANLLVGCVKLFDGPDVDQDMHAVGIFVFGRFEPSSAVGTYEEGQGDVENVNRDGGLTLVDTVHLERPPGNFRCPSSP